MNRLTDSPASSDEEPTLGRWFRAHPFFQYPALVGVMMSVLFLMTSSQDGTNSVAIVALQTVGGFIAGFLAGCLILMALLAITKGTERTVEILMPLALWIARLVGIVLVISFGVWVGGALFGLLKLGWRAL